MKLPQAHQQPRQQPTATKKPLLAHKTTNPEVADWQTMIQSPKKRAATAQRTAPSVGSAWRLPPTQ
jgi:hypothetical protein